MKKKLIITIIIGFSCFILGLALTGIGLFSGGWEKLEKISKPVQITQTYSNIDSLKIDGIHQHIVIKESSDERYHVSYFNSKNQLSSATSLKQDKGHITLSPKNTHFRIKGLLQAFSELVTQRNSNVQTIQIQIPKNKTLKKLEGANMTGVVIEKTSIETINFDGSLYLDKADIKGGSMNGYININDSKLKNLSILSQEGTISLTNTILEQVKIENYTRLDIRQVTLVGENVFTPNKQSLTLTNLDIKDNSFSTLSLNIHNTIDKKSLAKDMGYPYDRQEDPSYEETQAVQSLLEIVGIFTKDKYVKLPVSSKDTEQTLITQVANSKNKLTIKATNATINFRTPQ